MRQALEGTVDVLLPNDNCQDSRFMLSCFDDLVDYPKDDIDVVHWNNGLWDVLHFAENPSPFTSRAAYLASVGKIADKIKARFPNAKVCFATTTPIHERLQSTTSYRRNAEIKEYNECAVELLREKEVLINDLYEIALQYGEVYTSKDGLHYTNEGSELLSISVVNFLKKVLQAKC